MRTSVPPHLCLLKSQMWPCITCNPSTGEAWTGGFLWLPSQTPRSSQQVPGQWDTLSQQIKVRTDTLDWLLLSAPLCSHTQITNTHIWTWEWKSRLSPHKGNGPLGNWSTSKSSKNISGGRKKVTIVLLQSSEPWHCESPCQPAAGSPTGIQVFVLSQLTSQTVM